MLPLPPVDNPSLPPSPGGSTSSAASGDTYCFNDSEITKIPYIGSGARCRTAVACDKCRERKTKCSGERPVCKRCSSRGLICVYASRETKRRTHSGAPGVNPRQVPARDDVLDQVASISRTNSDGYAIQKPSHSSGVGVSQYSRRPSDPFIEQHHSSPYPANFVPSSLPNSYGQVDMNLLRSRGVRPSPYPNIPFDHFSGQADRNARLLAPNHSAPQHYGFDPLYQMRRQSASSESSASSLSSAPHTPIDACHTLTAYPNSCPNPAFPPSYAPGSDYNFSYNLGGNQASYNLGFGGKNHSSEAFHPTGSAASTANEHPDQQYDHNSGFPDVDQFRSRPVKFGPDFGVQMMDASTPHWTPSSDSPAQWAGELHSTPSPVSSWVDSYNATPLSTTPQEQTFDREGVDNGDDQDSKLTGSLLLEPLSTPLSLSS
ncbi:c6 transcription [Moniliophthora roreri MCA 2997]|nr:c6 transcription [Moniliophthora roreri MCA 2997]